jgi:recombinational DNA repair protein RecR
MTGNSAGSSRVLSNEAPDRIGSPDCTLCRHYHTAPYEEPCQSCIDLYRDTGILRALYEPEDEQEEVG